MPPANTYTAPQGSAFTAWKGSATDSNSNQNKKFYLIESGSTYKLGSVTGSNTALPTGAKPVDLNVAYAIDSKELSLTDWVMARMAGSALQPMAVCLACWMASQSGTGNCAGRCMKDRRA